MKKLPPHSFRFIPVVAGLAIGLVGNSTKAQNAYFDVNGATSGYGIVCGSTYSWDAANWGVSGGAGATVAWTPGTFARFYGGANPCSYTVTVNASESMAGMYLNFPGTSLNINDAGNNTGSLSITTGTAIPGVSGGNVQGFLIAGAASTLTINCPIVGPGGIEQQSAGALQLFGTNSYAGGTWVTGGQGIFYNNNYAFGKGVIYVPSGGGWFENDTGNALTITNRFVFPNSGVNYNFVSGPAVAGSPGTTWSGPVSLPAGGTILFNTSSGATTVAAFTGVISGAGANLNVSDNGTLILGATNTYTGATGVGAYTAGTTPSLEIAGAIAGNLVLTNSGTKLVQLDHPATLKSSASVYLSSSLAPGTVNLNFTGTNTILALYIDGTIQSAGTYGAPGNPSATYQYSLFNGSGVINVAAAPVIVQEPQSLSVYPQTPSGVFSVAVTGDQPSMTYQWKFNGGNLQDGVGVSGSLSSALSLSSPYTAGTYTCAITNSGGFTNTLPATLTILATNDYVNAVLGSPFGPPIAYWRLDETSGTVANDWVGLHAGTYVNANLNQPGFSAVPGSDRAMGVPANVGQKGYMVISNAAPDFSFSPSTPFTLEAWAMSTNFASGVKQRIFSYLTQSGNGGYGFGFPDANTLQFTAGGVLDFNMTISPALAAGVWYHFAATFDGNNYYFYINGNPIGSHAVTGLGIQPPVGPMCLGNNPLNYPGEQLFGGIDEAAIYNYALDQTTVTNHFLARYTDAPLSVSAPVVTPPTNYVSLSSTLTAVAAGTGLSYQWYHNAGTGSPVPGGTDATLTKSNLQLGDAGNYHVVVTDAGSHTQDSPLSYLAVLAIPTSASQLNLTNGLVLHLPFDSDYKDISGRSNHGTPQGSPGIVGPGAIGSGFLHYGTTNGVSTNYVTVGVRPDLQFGDLATGTDFSVAYWVRGTLNTNLPIFCDATGGEAGILALNGGYYFGPSTIGDGGWAAAVGSTAHEMTTSGANVINDGNWHSLVFVCKRSGSVRTYLDGVQVDNHPVSFVTDTIDTANPANIGQDGTGQHVFAQDQGGDIDDLAVWTRTLTDLEVSGLYLAGATNGVSFAPVVAVSPVATTITSISGTTLSYTGGGGAQFVLLGTNNVAAPLATWPRLQTNSATPGSFTIPAVGTGAPMFYRVKSE